MTMTEPTRTRLDRDGLRHEYHRGGHDRRSDAALVAAVAERLAVPREAPADSFVLHAPLELVARAALLPHVAPEGREVARLRLLSLADGFDASGPAFGAAARAVDADAFGSVDEAAGHLVAAIAAGDLDGTDVAADWLGRAASPAELRGALAGPVLASLAAAAHASIFLYQLPRVSPRGEVTGRLVRGLARELARYPDWRLQWIDALEPTAGAGDTGGTADDVFAAIAATPAAGPPESTFIFPTMASVDGPAGVAASLVGPVLGAGAAGAAGGVGVEPARAVRRAAAWSMLLEDDAHAPYGWSHALTLPQAVLGVADVLDPQRALAVAATYVVGFRSTLATRALEPTFPHADHPGPTAVPPVDLVRDALTSGPDDAAAAVWHAAPETRGEIVTLLATEASTRHDAHLVKYTLACLDAAADDPAHTALFLAAAASLVSWWTVRPGLDDPLAG